MSWGRGFTLIELMITIAILAIVTMIAVPNMSRMIYQYQLNADVKELMSVLASARSHAVMVKKDVSVSLTDNNSTSEENNFHWFPSYQHNQITHIPTAQTGSNEIEFNAEGIMLSDDQDKFISVCSEKLNLQKTIRYSFLGAFESIQEEACE